MKWIDDNMPYFTLTVARRTTTTYCSARPRKKSSETIEECHLLMSAAPEAAAQSQVTQPEKMCTENAWRSFLRDEPRREIVCKQANWYKS